MSWNKQQFKLLIYLTHSVDVFRMVLRVNSICIPKRKYLMCS